MPPSPALVPQHVLAHRRNPHGPGHQYQVKWAGQAEPSWVGSVAFRSKHAALVAAFERRAATGQRQPAVANSDPLGAQATAAGAKQRGEGVPLPAPGSAQQTPAVVVQASAPGGAPALASEPAQANTDDDSPQGQLTAAMQLVQEQARELQSLRAAQQQTDATLVAASQSRFARNQPRPQDLPEYDGAAGAKLDEWLQALSLTVGLYALNDAETIAFATFRLRGAALQWWQSLSAADKAASSGLAALSAALRARFQPVTAEQQAQERFFGLQQGGRHINDYIAEFQRLRALLPDTAEKDALFIFKKGLQPALRKDVNTAGYKTVAEAIALVARVGGLDAAAASAHTVHPSRAAAAHQMEVDDGNGEPWDDRDERIAQLQAQLNALTRSAPSSSSGVGAKTQTQRGYASERGGGLRGGRGGRGGRFAPPRPTTGADLGLPEHVVQQRREAGLCLRCGHNGHFAGRCPNNVSAGPGN